MVDVSSLGAFPRHLRQQQEEEEEEEEEPGLPSPLLLLPLRPLQEGSQGSNDLLPSCR